MCWNDNILGGFGGNFYFHLLSTSVTTNIHKNPNNFENLRFHGVTDLNLILWREPYTSRDVCWTEIGTRNLNFLSACCWRAPHCYNRGVCLKSDTQGNKTLRKRDPTQLKSLYLLTLRDASGWISSPIALKRVESHREREFKFVGFGNFSHWV